MPEASEAHNATQWTNPSVRALSKDEDPVDFITAKARRMVLDALDQGWMGPPFDPMMLATLLGIDVQANSDVRDARTVPIGRGKARIEFNPNRTRGRIRYSVAHEIAHTLFPDFADRVRNRAQHDELVGDEWQLEALCNIAAAEFLMPLGSLAGHSADRLGIRTVLELQRKFDVSMEALVIRLAETSELPLAGFCASPRDPAHFTRYHLDYMIPSRGWSEYRIPRRIRLPRDSVVRQCTAIGFSAQGVETWWAKSGSMQVDAVGIPPYPGGSAPRVVGLLRPVDSSITRTHTFSHVYGSALEPRGKDRRIVIQIVNDKTANWGGGGFASAVREKWPIVQEDFRDWVDHSRQAFRLGGVRITRVSENLSVASIVAQHGYGPSVNPRVRYAALRTGLEKVAHAAHEVGASIHMPRIGTGQAGGSWSIIRDLIRQTLVDAGVHTTVYDLPGSQAIEEVQTSLPLAAENEDLEPQ